MATFARQPDLPFAADAALGRLLQTAGVARHSAVRVTGSAGLAAVFWLDRHGYSRAVYAPAARIAAMAPADALVVAQTLRGQELAALLGDGAVLRPGGVLIVQGPPEPFAHGADSLRGVLAARNYRVERHQSDHGRDLYVARRLAVEGFSKAA